MLLINRAAFLLLILLLTIPESILGWGKTGHRVVGQIAYNHLTKKARKNVQKILGNESLANSANWMDFIRSDHYYDHLNEWHYATIPDSLNYQQAGTPNKGDVIVALERLISELKTKKFTDADELFALRCLVHLIGDIHQPLHVGNGKDKGGNDLKLKYMYESSNLHRVWDSGIIDEQQLSFSEYSTSIDFISKSQLNQWQKKYVIGMKHHQKVCLKIPLPLTNILEVEWLSLIF